ncbi:MAG TPA: hypothetical protein VMV86_01130 [Methanosarcinales archaeon]|nr:hypothetical protein [Methanosarcinales archaeon]
MTNEQLAYELLKLAKSLTVPERHQKNIAIKTLKMSDAGAKIMGGMTKEEARDFLKSVGYSDSKIKRLEASIKKQASIQIDISAATDWGFGHIYGTLSGRMSDLSYNGLTKDLQKTARAMVKRYGYLCKDNPDVKQLKPIMINSVSGSEIVLSLEFEKNKGTVLE